MEPPESSSENTPLLTTPSSSQRSSTQSKLSSSSPSSSSPPPASTPSCMRPSFQIAAALLILSAALALLVLSVNSVSSSPHQNARLSARAGRRSSPSETRLSFAVIGDWGRRGLYGQKELGNSMPDSLLPDTAFIISAGDNFYDDGVDTVYDSHFRESYEDVYDDPRLGNLPWHVTLGNHDHHGVPAAQIAYSDISQRWNLPAPYYSKILSPGVLGVFLDTTPFTANEWGVKARSLPGGDPNVQRAWLHNTLSAAAPPMRFFIVGHHNMYSASTAKHMGATSVRLALEPILMPFADRIIAYVAGHEHSLQHLQPHPHAFDHIISGAGSKLYEVHTARELAAGHWLECCGVLVETLDESVPRTIWARATNGYFQFVVDGDTFSAMAFNASAQLIYKFEKQLQPL